jgi:serine/threonine protein phosphatase PrpC
VIEVRWGSASHQGRVRERNEDSLLAGPDVFAVADGMGGHAGGDVASAIAVARLAEVCDLASSDDPEEVLGASLSEVNAEIRRRASAEPQLAGMGTTVAGIARVAGPRVLVFHVGDSRAYRLRGGRLEQLTEDHSVVADLVRSGELSVEEARSHPDRNTVTRALGAADDVVPVLRTETARTGDCFLVASDGLFDELPATQIGDLLSTAGTVEQRARALVDAALARGARDNVSVIVVVVSGTHANDGMEDDTAPPASRQRVASLTAPRRVV